MKSAGRDRHVLGARAQRHHRGRHFVAGSRDLLERAVAHERQQIHVRRRDDAHVDLHGPGGADALDFAFLQRAQGFACSGIDIDATSSMKSSPVRQLEAADARVDRAGERA